MVCVWPVFILVNMTCCFIYLYFFSGNFPHFPFLCTCPRSSHFCCYFHTRCHCTHQSCPVLGKAMGWCLIRTLTCACVSELFRARGHCGPSVCHAPSPVYARSHWLCLSLALEVHPLVSTLIHCQDLLLAVPRMGMTPVVIMLGISFPDRPVMERKASDY